MVDESDIETNDAESVDSTVESEKKCLPNISKYLCYHGIRCFPRSVFDSRKQFGR